MPLNAPWRRTSSVVAASARVFLGACLFGSLASASCSFRTSETSHTGTGGSIGNGGTTGAAGMGGMAPPQCNPCTDFPIAPVIDVPVGGTMPPSDVAQTFGPAGSGSATGGPCLSDPEPNSLFPKNWLRPRFVVHPGAGEDVFEIRLHADLESNDLVVYTTATTWTLPGPIWTALSRNVVGKAITVSVRGMVSQSGAVALGPTETIMIAPTDAKGTIVYWTTSGVTALKGFGVGQESVVTVLTPADTPGKCVGCHSSTPGGEFIGFSDSTASNNGDPSHIEIRSGTNPANQPPFLTPTAQTLLQRVSQELPVFSAAHWSNGDHVTVFMHADSSTGGAQNTHLLWIDLEATSQTQGQGWGELARTGDPNPAAAYPFFSHDGTRIVYASAPAANPSGIMQHGDLYSVDYGNRAGGAATPIDGAATTAYSEFYPALSSDDKLLAYTRLPDGASSYNNAASEVFIINSKGGTPLRHTANDPGMCVGKTSPGITNSWPKWSPTAGTDGGKTYYWITFSSTRSGNPQLYVAGIVMDETGNVTTTPALYLWNQPPTENNHTPAWDTFIIPPPG